MDQVLNKHKSIAPLFNIHSLPFGPVYRWVCLFLWLSEMVHYSLPSYYHASFSPESPEAEWWAVQCDGGPAGILSSRMSWPFEGSGFYSPRDLWPGSDGNGWGTWRRCRMTCRAHRTKWQNGWPASVWNKTPTERVNEAVSKPSESTLHT